MGITAGAPEAATWCLCLERAFTGLGAGPAGARGGALPTGGFQSPLGPEAEATFIPQPCGKVLHLLRMCLLNREHLLSTCCVQCRRRALRIAREHNWAFLWQERP